MEFIVESCHLLESVYDPFLRWRAYLSGKEHHGAFVAGETFKSPLIFML